METSLEVDKGFLKRKITNAVMLTLSAGSTVLMLIPLVVILFYTLQKGLSAIDFDFFTKLPLPVGESGGGVLNSIVGTLYMVGVASLIGVPIGVFSGIFLAEYEYSNPRAVMVVRFLSDVLNGIPSIVYGIAAYTAIVVPMKRFSALAGSVALGVMMIPIITRTTEEVIKLVPVSIREASLALGIPQWRTMVSVILKTALTGIATGVLLAIARVMGETAPLLFTALNNKYLSTALDQPMSSLSVQIYNYSITPFEDWQAKAWASALLLVLLVLTINIIFRVLTRKPAMSK